MRVLIFGGTTEGYKLSAAMSNSGMDVTLSVATDFGRSLAAEKGMTVLSDRLGEESMLALLKQGAFDYVIDTTHPYADIATNNIRNACQDAGIKYLRLKRPESAKLRGVTYAANAAAAADMLKKSDGKVLLTIGSKALEPFTGIDNYAERCFVRILPMQDSLKKAFDLGFHGPNIICMQGPFSREMNAAMLKTTGAKYLVTKDSGDAGGVEEKVSAAISLGCEVIIIARPTQEEGYSLDELLRLFHIGEAQEQLPKQTAFFPLFIDFCGKRLLVIGGGNVAERRIKVLSAFGADITVISPQATEYIRRNASNGALRLIERKYKNNDISDLNPFLVVAATDDRRVNHEVMMEAVSLNIQISVADSREECTCYFPAIAESSNYIAGLVSKNGEHTGVSRMAEKIRGLLNT